MFFFGPTFVHSSHAIRFIIAQLQRSLMCTIRDISELDIKEYFMKHKS